MTKSETTVPASIEEAAAYWALKLDAPSCAPADRAAFEAWRDEDARHAEAYQHVVAALATVDKALGSDELIALGGQVFAETEVKRRPLLRSAITGIAAALTLALGSALFFAMTQEPDPVTPVVADVSYETAVGERSTVDLPDGSTVVLNTASRIEIDYDPATRNVILVAGHAHFDVAPDAARPFVVAAGDRRIEAIGTIFDVRVDDTVGVQVTLIEGRVIVDEIQPAAGGNVGTVDTAPQQLEPGEQLVVRADVPPQVGPADLERVVSWQDGQLLFRDDALADAVEEINRYSMTQVYVSDDPRLHEIRISGVFKSGRTDSFVLALETVYPVKAQQVSEGRIALLWSE